jgi:hypothetical protein
MRLPFAKFKASWLLLFMFIFFFQCQKENELPKGDPDNGGLFLPDGFEALVVVDSLPGRARHIAVNDNGDIYVKSRFSKPEGRNAAMRDTTFDGKPDIFETFSSYEKERSYGTAMRIYNGYVYFASERSILPPRASRSAPRVSLGWGGPSASLPEWRPMSACCRRR